MKKDSGHNLILVAVCALLLAISCGRGKKEIEVAKAGNFVLSGEQLKKLLPEGFFSAMEDDAIRIVSEWSNEAILAEAAEDLKLDKDPDVVAKLDEAKRMIFAAAIEEKLIIPRIKLDSTEVFVYYQSHTGDFVRDEDEVHCLHIMIIDSVYSDTVAALLKNDTISFEDVAMRYSQDPATPEGGDIGFLAKSQIHPKLAQAAFSLEKGKTAGPIITEFGTHFIKVIDTAPKGSLRDYSLVEAEIRDILMDDKFREAYNEVLDSLKKEKGVSIDTNAIKTVFKANEK